MNIKKMFDKLLDMPIPYMITIATVVIIITALVAEGSITIVGVVGVVVLGILIGLQVDKGSIVIKSVISVLTVLFATSLYTDLVMKVNGYITQPFLLSLSGVSVFLAQTYSSRNHNAGLRSRGLWSSVLAITLITLKSAVILAGLGYWIAEVIGLNYLVTFIFAWRLWIANSNKTKIVEPTIIDKEVQGKFKLIYIKNRFDSSSSQWSKGEFVESVNAYPYIHNEVIKAREEGLILVMISSYSTDETYDVGEIDINKSIKIPYLYMEAKEDTYIDVIMAGFMEDIQMMQFDKR